MECYIPTFSRACTRKPCRLLFSDASVTTMTKGGDEWLRLTDDVTANEAASYAFCAKAWHLERVVKSAPPADVVRRREDGAGMHEADGERLLRATRVRSRMLLLTVALLLLAGLLLLLAVVAGPNWR